MIVLGLIGEDAVWAGLGDGVDVVDIESLPKEVDDGELDAAVHAVDG